MVELRLTPDHFEMVERDDDVDDDRIFHKIKEEHIAIVKEKYISAIQSAASEQAKFVCFGEMTYPFTGIQADDDSFIEQLARLSSERHIFIIAGSFHHFTATKLKRYNTSYIFTPYQAEPFEQYKMHSATRANERVDRPLDEDVLVFQAEFGNFAVLLCLDGGGQDFWFKAGLLNKDELHKGIQFVLVIAFDKSEKMLNAVQSAARARAVCTGFVNAYDFPPQQQNPRFFSSDGSDLERRSVGNLVNVFEIKSEHFKPPVVVTTYRS